MTVPDVLNLSKENAASTIKNANLNFRTSDVGNSVTAGAIAVEQSPKAGTVVERGTVVYVKFMFQDVD